MFDYVRYLLLPILTSISAYGLWQGGAMVWLGLGTLFGVFFLDAFLEPDLGERDQRFPWIYDTIVVFQLSFGFALVLSYCYWVGVGHFTETYEHVGAFLTMMFTLFVLVAPVLHEMFHRENTAQRWFGRLGMVLLFDPWREITHVVTHHIHTVTPNDPDYARRGDNLYSHLIKTFKEQIAESYHLEKMMWTKRDRKWWNIRNAWVWRVSIVIGFFCILLAIGGWTGALAATAVCILGPRVFLEIFNYTQHYGLVTGTPGRFENHHTWNHLTPFVRILALEITNHAGHHRDSYMPFYRLEVDKAGPRQPQFFLCVLMAFIPPLWFAMIRPRLAEWDRSYATPQERELAEAENIRAGWSDLNENSFAANERYAYAI